MPKRENGAGSIYKRSDVKARPWVATAPATYVWDEKKQKSILKQKSIGQYASRAEARKALDEYMENPTEKLHFTFKNIYDEWMEIKTPKISKSMVSCYRAAYHKFADLENLELRSITLAQLDSIVQNCGQSVSSQQQMKVLLSQMYDYAMLHNVVNKNLGEYVEITGKRKVKDDAFTTMDVEKMWRNVDKVPYTDYLLCLCYTGFRISEFLALTRFQYDREAHTLTGGSKTEAGKDRVVPVHPRIVPLVEACIAKGGDTIFCRPNGKPFNKDSFRKDVWFQLLARLGLPETYTPHATRHTCATMLSAAGGRPEDIQKILGHTDYALTSEVYINQEVSTLRKTIEKLA